MLLFALGYRRRDRGVQPPRDSRSACPGTRCSSGRSSRPGSVLPLARRVQRGWPRGRHDRGRRRVRRRRVRHRVHRHPGDVTDELRGRTFATLYAVVRLCLLLSLTVSPLFADLYEWLFSLAAGAPRITRGRVQLRLPRRAPRALGRCPADDRLGPLRPPRAARDARAHGRAPASFEPSPVAPPEAAAGDDDSRPTRRPRWTSRRRRGRPHRSRPHRSRRLRIAAPEPPAAEASG